MTCLTVNLKSNIIMKHKTSYKIHSFSIDAEKEIKRLKAQVELFWDRELAFYKTFGLSNGMKIVECGCGPGFAGQKLHAVFPDSHVTAFEIDPFLMEAAKRNARLLELERYEVSERSIMDTGLPDNTFDFAVTRLVLEHLPDPVAAVKEVYRILKPGQKAVFIDNDFEFHMRTHPDIPELRDLYSAYCAARQKQGGNPKIGRELPGILKLAGFSNIDLRVMEAHSHVTGDEIFLKSEGSGIPAQLVKDGYLSKETYSRIALKWNRLLKIENHSIFRQLFICAGEKKPGNDSTDNRVDQSAFQSQPGHNQAEQQEIKPPDEGWTSDKNRVYEAPVTLTEKKVAAVWQEILGIESIGINENFFEAGGSSVHAPEIIELLEKKFSKELSLVDLFDYPTIALFAKKLAPGEQVKEHLSSSQRQAARRNKVTERREMIQKLRKQKTDS